MLIGGRFATFWINLGCDDLLHSAWIWERCVASLSCVALRCVALLCSGRIGSLSWLRGSPREVGPGGRGEGVASGPFGGPLSGPRPSAGPMVSARGGQWPPHSPRSPSHSRGARGRERIRLVGFLCLPLSPSPALRCVAFALCLVALRCVAGPPLAGPPFALTCDIGGPPTASVAGTAGLIGSCGKNK